MAGEWFVKPLKGSGWLKGTHQIQTGVDVEHSDLDQTDPAQ